MLRQRGDGAPAMVAASRRPEPDDCGQLEGTRRGGTVVLGTVTGPPPPTGPADPDDLETGFPGPCVRCKRTSRVPVFAVVTKPPMLGLAMFHSENVIGMSASTAIAGSDPLRRDGEAHGLRHSVHRRDCPRRCSARRRPSAGIVPRSIGAERVSVAVGYWLTSMMDPSNRAFRSTLVAHDARHVDSEGRLRHRRTGDRHGAPDLAGTAHRGRVLPDQDLLDPVARLRTRADVPGAIRATSSPRRLPVRCSRSSSPTTWAVRAWRAPGPQ